MKELQKDFLHNSIENLTRLSESFDDESLSENFLRECFRTLHTAKGTAQTFGFANLGSLAHDLENLLQAAREEKIPADKLFNSLLREGLAYLTEMFRQRLAGEETKVPKLFVEKICLISRNDASTEKFSLHLPKEFLSQLSNREKNRLDAAVENGKNLFLVEAGFTFADFANEFKKFKDILDENGETVATFPGFKFPSRVGFQVFLVTDKSFAEITRIIAPFAAEINFKIEKDQTVFGGYLEAVLSQAVEGAKKLSRQFEKEIEFDVSLAAAEVPVEKIKILFDILLHLTRNAIDHGIERKGTITIRLETDESCLHLTVADDGRGINLERVRAKAVEKNLIAADMRLTEAEILQLIFRHGFSTGETVSEISGRGVGLDIVKDSVEKEAGEIRVKSEKGKGTTFEIFLPNEEVGRG